mgnify:FL=1
MDIYQISDRYTYLKESSIKHNKNYLFSKKGKYFFDENLSIYYRSSIDTLTKYNTDKKEAIAIKPRKITNERHYQSIVLDDLEFIYPFACRNELGLIVQKQFTLSLILNN